MISIQEIRENAKRSGVMTRVIEKDYYLGILLNAISKDPNKKDFIFKGGTALRKCYFNNYRFSEDIDFTVIKRQFNQENILSGLIKAWCKKSNADFGTTFELYKLSLEREIYGQESYSVTVHYQGIEGRGKINIDFTFYEQVESKPLSKQIKHAYSDKADYHPSKILVYSLEEIMAEKLRAISFIHYYPRNRDLYDICYIANNARINRAKLTKLFVAKCRFKGIDPVLLKEVNAVYLSKFKKSWDIQLGHQIKNLPDFQQMTKEFVTFAKTISQNI